MKIEANELGKTYRIAERRPGRFGTLRSILRPVWREVTAVKGIGFKIDSGESVAYLGPNGAGKSTTIKMLTGILKPTEGAVTLNGLDPHKNRKLHSRQIGCVFGQRSQLMFDLPVKDSFDLLRYMYSIERSVYKRNVEQYAALLDIEKLFEQPVRTLSLGQRMRCELMAALLHDPEILFLDEPTLGLDVVAKERIRLFIERMNREKKVTVLLTTHDLSDIERLCPRTIIIDKGKLIYDGSLATIKQRYATKREIRMAMADPPAARAIADRIRSQASLSVNVEQATVKVIYDQRAETAPELLRFLLDQGSPRDLVIQDESIESLVRRIYEEGVDWQAEAGASHETGERG